MDLRSVSASPSKIARKRKREVPAGRDLALKRMKVDLTTSDEFFVKLPKVALTSRALEHHNQTAYRTRPKYPRRPDGKLPGPNEDLRDLKRFSRTGGPDLTDLRGYPEPPEDIAKANMLQPPRAPVREGVFELTAEALVYDTTVEEAMEQNGATTGASQLPSNWEAIRSRMNQPRPELSPVELGIAEWQHHQRKLLRASMGAEHPSAAFAVLRGDDGSIRPTTDRPFDFMERFPADGPVVPHPDFFDAEVAGKIKEKIRDEIGGVTVASMKPPAKALPNFTGHATYNFAPAQYMNLKALHAGVVGARAMHAIQWYGVHSLEPVEDNNAYVITATYRDSLLALYTVHQAASTSPKREWTYHMNKLGEWKVGRSLTDFRNGVAAFRNLRNWAHEQRVESIDSVNLQVFS